MKKSLLLFLIFSGLFCTPNKQASIMTNDAPKNITTDSSGIYVKDFQFSPDCLFQKQNWKGDWIWLNETEFPEYQETHTTWINNLKSAKKYRAFFRKNFNIKKEPKQAILSITGDVSFRVYINGEFVCQGPPNIGSDYDDHKPPEHWFYSSHDVKQYLQPGKNTIAVEVYSFDLALSETTSGKGKFICDVNINPDEKLLFTDFSWKCTVDTSLTTSKEGLVFNADEEIPDWQALDFDDSKWPNVSVKRTPKSGYLVQSEIPNTIRHKQKAAKTYKLSQDGKDKTEQPMLNQVHFSDTFLLDLKKNMSAYYTFSCTAHKGDKITISPREKTSINRPLEYICKDGLNTFTTPQLNVFRYLTIKIASQNGLEFHSFDALYSTYPVNHVGSFACSDSFYTQLWDITRWTTQMCMNSLYLDSPKHQEPIACTGDYLIESLSNFYAFGDPWLARQDLDKTARMLRKNGYDMFHTSYSLLWVQMLYNYFQYTGDEQLVKELLPDVNNLNDLFKTYLDENFLLSQAPDYMFMDWISIAGFNAHHSPAVIGMGYLSAFYYHSLLLGAELNDLLNNTEKSRQNIELAKSIKTGINSILWDESKGLYRDGIPFKTRIKPHRWLPGDEDIETFSPHINALAVLYDIAPKEKQNTIMDYVVTQQQIDLQPYFMYFVLSALTHVNRFDSDGLSFINKWKNGIDLETYTLKENWQDQTEFGYGGDFSHAWGGSPLYYLSSQVLGITPGKPGYEEIRFEPFVSDKLSWAKGTVPLNSGISISVSWERTNNSYSYNIFVPEKFQVVLHHPQKLKAYTLHINNKQNKIDESGVKLAEGTYKIEYKN